MIHCGIVYFEVRRLKIGARRQNRVVGQNRSGAMLLQARGLITFKDETDLNGFVRWILRYQAKREAATLEP